MQSSKVRTNLANAEVDGALLRAGLNLTPNAAAGVTQKAKGAVIRRATLKLTNFAVAVTAANDYGGTKLADLPNGNVLVLGAVVNLTFTSTGIDTTPANVDVAVGTVVASNATLSGTMLNIVPKIDATAGSVVRGAATSTEAAKVFATSSSGIFLNVAAATTVDGSLSFSGTVEFFYLDLGDQTTA